MDEHNPYLIKTEAGLEITPEGKAFLDTILTDSQGQVYVFNDKIAPVMVAAAMARLSRRGSDLRETFLDEFAFTGKESAEKLIKRVVTAYGDDSVQQLTGLHLVVEGASNILSKLLEWGRLMSYLEQSTRYIYFDQRDREGKYLYYTPQLPKKLQQPYQETMDQLFGLYSTVVRATSEHVRVKFPEPEDKKERQAWLGATRAQACDAARPMLPAATKSTIGIYGSAQAVESLIIHLLSEPLKEAEEVGMALLREARKVVPAFLERTDLPERGGATTAYRAGYRSDLEKLSQKLLKGEDSFTQEVQLVEHWPVNENDLLAELLFESSHLSLAHIKTQVEKMGEEQKMSIFRTSIGERLNRRHKPGRAIEKAHFEWEIVGDYGNFRDLQRHRMVDSWEWQRLTPYLGYEVPSLIKEAGQEGAFKQSFELSQKLYEQMREVGCVNEAQYAVLFGYRLRYRFIINLRSLFHFLELRTSPQGHPGYRRIGNEMYQQLKEVYPLFTEAMKFVNQDEDPHLTRLAAERATQFKLSRLE